MLSFLSAKSANFSHVVAICKSSALSLMFSRRLGHAHAFGSISAISVSGSH